MPTGKHRAILHVHREMCKYIFAIPVKTYAFKYVVEIWRQFPWARDAHTAQIRIWCNPVLWQCVHKPAPLYRVSPQKSGTADFSLLCELKVSYFLTSLNKTSSAEENDAKIIEFGWVILILCPFLQFLQFFAWFLRPMSVDFIGKGLPYGVFEEAHWSVSTKYTT